MAADFDAGGQNVFDSATVKGKKKKGALQLQPSTVLCSITTRGGKKFEARLAAKHSPLHLVALEALMRFCPQHYVQVGMQQGSLPEAAKLASEAA